MMIVYLSNKSLYDESKINIVWCWILNNGNFLFEIEWRSMKKKIQRYGTLHTISKLNCMMMRWYKYVFFCNGTTLYHFFFHFPLPHFFSMWYDVCVSPTAEFVILFVDHYYIHRHIYIHISWAGRFLFRFLFSFVLFFFLARLSSLSSSYLLSSLSWWFYHLIQNVYDNVCVCVCACVLMRACFLFIFHCFFFVSFVCFCSFPLIMISSKHASRFTPFGRHLVDTNTQYIDFIHWRWGAIVGATFFLLPLCLSIFFYYITPSPKILLSVKCVFFLFHFI